MALADRFRERPAIRIRVKPWASRRQAGRPRPPARSEGRSATTGAVRRHKLSSEAVGNNARQMGLAVAQRGANQVALRTASSGAMPRYWFHIEDDRCLPDGGGVELATLDEVCAVAVAHMAEMSGALAETVWTR